MQVKKIKGSYFEKCCLSCKRLIKNLFSVVKIGVKMDMRCKGVVSFWMAIKIVKEFFGFD